MDSWEAALRGHFLFRGADELVAEALALPVEVYRRGETICNGGSQRRALGILLEGKAEAVGGEQQSVLTVFSAGGTFGAAALFGGGGYVSHVRAVTGCTVLFLTQELLEEWFRRCPVLAVNYITFLSGRVRFLNGKIAILTQDSAQHRLYRWLQANCGEDGRLPEKVSMTKLASTLAMGRTSLYRALEELETAGLIARDGKRIEVLP